MEDNSFVRLDNVANALETIEGMGNVYGIRECIRNAKYYKEELFKYAKFKVGQTVKLRKIPVINDQISWGWLGYKDLFIQDALIFIESIEHFSLKFRYGFKFLPKGQGTFTLTEDYFANTDGSDDWDITEGK